MPRETINFVMVVDILNEISYSTSRYLSSITINMKFSIHVCLVQYKIRVMHFNHSHFKKILKLFATKNVISERINHIES